MALRLDSSLLWTVYSKYCGYEAESYIPEISNLTIDHWAGCKPQDGGPLVNRRFMVESPQNSTRGMITNARVCCTIP